MFQHTAARRRLEVQEITSRFHGVFQHTAARRRLAQDCRGFVHEFSVSSTHSRPKAAGEVCYAYLILAVVSTHSRPKAAGCRSQGIPFVVTVSTHSRPKAAGIDQWAHLTDFPFQHTAARRRLVPSTQKPVTDDSCFNTQPPEGGWAENAKKLGVDKVSTHSRPKAAGVEAELTTPQRPTAVSTHSRPKAAGNPTFRRFDFRVFQHTAARRRLVDYLHIYFLTFLFQHTAARRRLAKQEKHPNRQELVSTHSRPKAAGYKAFFI